jgi:competence ComEA-like helix-hairpin-helix protein
MSPPENKNYPHQCIDAQADFITSDSAASRDKTVTIAFVTASFICVIFCLVFAAVIFHRTDAASAIRLDGQINPNTATVGSLIRLPNVGKVRASAIVNYRDQYIGLKPDHHPFKKSSDLKNVKGIGPKTVQDINNLLKFDEQ